jgi:transposase-like protein
MSKKNKRLTEKQQMALELMTSGKGYKYKEIAEMVGVNPKTLWDWRNEPEFTHFQDALNLLNEQRWLATVDAARASALKLCLDGNQKMVEFILKNDGLNPTQKVEAEINTDIVINLE